MNDTSTLPLRSSILGLEMRCLYTPTPLMPRFSGKNTLGPTATPIFCTARETNQCGGLVPR